MATEKLVNIKEVDKYPYDMLVEIVETMLEQAKSGELRGIIFAKLWDNETTSNGWVIEGDKKYSISALLGETFQVMTELSNQIKD